MCIVNSIAPACCIYFIQQTKFHCRSLRLIPRPRSTFAYSQHKMGNIPPRGEELGNHLKDAHFGCFKGRKAHRQCSSWSSKPHCSSCTRTHHIERCCSNSHRITLLLRPPSPYYTAMDTAQNRNLVHQGDYLQFNIIVINDELLCTIRIRASSTGTGPPIFFVLSILIWRGHTFAFPLFTSMDCAAIHSRKFTLSSTQSPQLHITQRKEGAPPKAQLEFEAALYKLHANAPH